MDPTFDGLFQDRKQRSLTYFLLKSVKIGSETRHSWDADKERGGAVRRENLEAK